MKMSDYRLHLFLMLLMCLSFNSYLFGQIYSIFPDPKTSTEVLFADGATEEDANDQIEYVSITALNDSTVTIKAKWFASSTGNFTSTNGLHIKSFLHDGVNWTQVYSQNYLPSELVLDSYKLEEFNVTVPPGSGSDAYIRVSLIDKSTANDSLVGYYGCRSCGSASDNGRHYDNVDIKFSLNNGTTSNYILMPSGYGNTLTSCNSIIFDDGGDQFNYSNDFKGSLTIYPVTSGSKVKLSFDQFKTESCCDELIVYDGNNTNSSIIGTYLGSNLPTDVISTSTDGSLTLEFNSDISVNDSGWKISSRCYTPIEMQFSNCSANQSISIANTGDNDVQILQIPVEMSGSLNPKSLTSLTFKTTGTSNTSDIDNAKVYFTGQDANFSTATQFGGNIGSPSGTFTISGSQALQEGTNYFWLAYDISSTAGNNNLVDAEITALAIDGNNKIPTNGNPTGAITVSNPYSPVTLPWTEDFENVGPVTSFTSNSSSINGAPEWAYDKTNTGRLRFDAGYSYSGSYAASLDASTSSVYSTNYLTAKVNLANYTTSNILELSFSYRTFDDEAHADDKVWIRGSSSDSWIEVFDFGANQTSNWKTISGIDIDSALAVNGQSVSSAFQVRFGQYDNYYIATDGLAIDDVKIEEAVPLPMQYQSSTAYQASTQDVIIGSSDNAILKVAVETSGELNPLGVGSLSFSTQGSAAPATDIKSARVYFTGLKDSLSFGAQYGTAVSKPSGNFTVSGSANLLEGTNYFWLVYDIESGATDGNSVDARCTAVNVGGSTKVPSVTSPYGYRAISNDILMPPTTGNSVSVCSAKFYDNGGSSSYYTGNADGEITIYPSTPGAKIRTTFNSFRTESYYDKLYVYDGNSTSANLLGSYDGYSLPPVLTSSATDGSLTFRFDNDYYSNYSGWDADISCYTPTNMQFDNCIVAQAASTAITGDNDVQILQIPVEMSGSLNPKSLTSLTFKTTGTSNTSDIDNAKVYFTGQDANFSTATQFGGNIGSPSGTFTISGSQALQEGTNYFWLAYDISSTAGNNNLLDAEIIAMVIGGNNETPSNGNPTGAVTISNPYPPVTLPWTEDFENVGPVTSFTSNSTPINGAPEWSYEKTSKGRLQFDNGHSNSGAYAATLDADSVAFSHNKLIATVNLINYTTSNKLALSFSYKSYNDETHPEDKVWIRGNKTENWIEVYDLGTNQSSNWKTISGIDIDSILANNGQNVSSTFQVRFGQYDNYYASNSGLADGISIDDIIIEESSLLPIDTMTFESATCSHLDLLPEYNGTRNVEMIKLKIKTKGKKDPIKLSNIYLEKVNVTDLSDITKVKVYYTGSDSLFSVTDLYGESMDRFKEDTIYGSQILSEGDNYFWITYDISKTAKDSNLIDAAIQSITIDSIYMNIPINGSPLGYKRIKHMSFSVSASTWQASTDDINIGSSNQEIIKLQIDVSGNTFSSLYSVKFLASGVDDLNDIRYYRVYYTGNQDAFNTSNLYAWGYRPNSDILELAGFASLTEGSNYFWLAYSISDHAIEGNHVDASCLEINVNRKVYIPTQKDPIGKRKITTPLDIGSFTANDKTMLYPNPTNDLIFIMHPENNVKLIRIFDASGKEVHVIYSPEKEHSFDFKDYATGIYYFNVITNKSSKTYKVIYK